MTIRHLTIFRMVCQTGGITKAAEQLYMTQPAVTHAIRELEQALGISLFDRYARKLFLTETGKQFLDKTEQLLSLYAELE